MIVLRFLCFILVVLIATIPVFLLVSGAATWVVDLFHQRDVSMSAAYGELYFAIQVGLAAILGLWLSLWRVWIGAIPVILWGGVNYSQFYPEAQIDVPAYICLAIALAIAFLTFGWLIQRFVKPWIFQKPPQIVTTR